MVTILVVETANWIELFQTSIVMHQWKYNTFYTQYIYLLLDIQISNYSTVRELSLLLDFNKIPRTLLA